MSKGVYLKNIDGWMTTSAMFRDLRIGKSLQNLYISNFKAKKTRKKIFKIDSGLYPHGVVVKNLEPRTVVGVVPAMFIKKI